MQSSSNSCFDSMFVTVKKEPVDLLPETSSTSCDPISTGNPTYITDPTKSEITMCGDIHIKREVESLAEQPTQYNSEYYQETYEDDKNSLNIVHHLPLMDGSSDTLEMASTHIVTCKPDVQTDPASSDHRSDKLLNRKGRMPKRHVCQICQKAFSRNSNLRRHEQQHIDNKPFSCEHCPRRFSTKHIMNVHTRTVHTGERPFACEICSKQFTNNQSLTLHMRIHTGEKPYQCQICQKRFKSRDSLYLHANTHLDFKPFVCDICQKDFTTRKQIKIHMRHHSSRKPFNCDICQMGFIFKSFYDAHMLKHTGIKCNICQTSYTNKQSLQKHMTESSHNGLIPYRCNICPKSYKYKKQLDRHEFTHFITTTSLQINHRCNICEKQFSTKNSLKRHESVHTGEKKFPCNICQKRFAYKDKLKVHMRKAHLES